MTPRIFESALCLILLAACSNEKDVFAQNAPEAAEPGMTTGMAALQSDAPAGEYKLDKAHASLVFTVSHLGLSDYTARFTGWDAILQFDPDNPETMQVRAEIDPRSLETHYPGEDLDFNATIAGEDWLDAGAFPQMRFQSTGVEQTGPAAATLTGDLTLHGVTQPVTMDVEFNGGYAGNAMDPAGSRIGFSAHGALKRSDFGISLGVPEPGSSMGVSDRVMFEIEAEFTRGAQQD